MASWRGDETRRRLKVRDKPLAANLIQKCSSGGGVLVFILLRRRKRKEEEGG